MVRIRRGELASVVEIMLVASIPRQTANRWLREAGVALSELRLRAVAKMREQEELYLAGLPPHRKPTKKQMRREIERGIKRFNAANAKHPKVPDKATGSVSSVPASRRHSDVPG